MATRKDPYVNFNFLVEIDGISRAAFQEASGLESSIDVIEHREGGHNITPHKLPGQAKFASLSLKWGMSDDRDLYDWHRQWLSGDPAATRRSGSIVLLDRQGQEKARWNFSNAWPSKWTGPSFSAEASDVAVDAMELTHEGLVRA